MKNLNPKSKTAICIFYFYSFGTIKHSLEISQPRSSSCESIIQKFHDRVQFFILIVSIDCPPDTFRLFNSHKTAWWRRGGVLNHP